MKSRELSGGSIRTEITRVNRQEMIACRVARRERKNILFLECNAVSISFSVSRTNRGDFKGRPTAVADVHVGP